MTYRIKLTPSTPSLVKFKGRDSFRVQITASDAEDMPNEVFGHKRTLVDPETNDYQDEFAFVCSPYDLSLYPANEPDPEQFPPFFRKATIDILVPGIEMAQDVITQVEEQVCHLVTLMGKLDELEEGTAVWCPDAPPDSSSI